MEWSGIKEYDVLPTGDKNIPAGEAYKTKVEEVSELKLLNKTAYNKLILIQKYTVCFKIIEEAKKKIISTEATDKRERNFQKIFSQPQGLPTQEYKINSKSEN